MRVTCPSTCGCTRTEWREIRFATYSLVSRWSADRTVSISTGIAGGPPAPIGAALLPRQDATAATASNAIP